MSLIEKVKQWLRQWLFKEEINRFNEETEKMKKFQSQLSQAHMNLALANSKIEAAINSIENMRKLIGSICEIGTDIDIVRPSDYNNNWAVICVHGKMDYVKFIPMAQPDIRSISEFLKQFKYSNRVIDTPMKCVIENDILRW